MKKKRKTKNLLIIFFELLILVIFAQLLLRFNLFITFAFYLVAVGYAFYKKLIFKKKNIAFMIIFGTVLSYIAGTLLPYALGSYLAGDLISAGIIGALIIYLFYRGYKLKK
jgi:hypothetical protein